MFLLLIIHVRSISAYNPGGFRGSSQGGNSVLEEGSPESEDGEVRNAIAGTQKTLWPSEVFASEVIRSEVNFLVLPFFSLSRRDATQRSKTEYHTTVKRGDETLDVYWGVHGHPRYGYPRPFDSQVHKAIEQIISQLHPPIENPVALGSLYHIARLMGLRDSGRVYHDIKAAIQRTVATVVESKGTFYLKGTKRWLEDTFHLYERVVFAGEVLPNGETAETNYLFLSSWYLENVNSRHVKPLDYTYYRSLRSRVAGRLYELLGVKFYGMGSHPYIRYRYSMLCQLLPLVRQRKASNAKQNLQWAHQELTRSAFLSKVEWSPVPGEARDWYVTYWPGPRAREEIRRLPRQQPLQVQPAGDTNEEMVQSLSDQLAEDQPPEPDVTRPGKQPRIRLPKEKPAIQQAEEERDGVRHALEAFGVSKGAAKKLAQSYPEAHILDKLELAQWLVSTGSPLVAKNPAGWLRRAIEEDYAPPKNYQSSQQQAKGEREAKIAQAEVRERRMAEEEYRRVKAETKAQLLKQYPPQPIGEEGLTTESVWDLTLQRLKEQVPAATYETWLQDTVLLQVTDQAAQIAVSSAFAIAWLERRMYREICNALKGVLGKDLDLQFVTTT
jgi:hypothetical protein